ncbi:uncharacterized protein V2V93DRAFT_280230 [Kockiozyma suomiensis]|uniref:uncharacterized protein n=1 Tax=Kockiozyma suomiensis TaxID=1337062 RepID=UPI0033433C7D
MAGGHGHGPKTFSGPIDIHPPRPLYRFSNLILGASMWFWIMYRLKEDGPVLFTSMGRPPRPQPRRRAQEGGGTSLNTISQYRKKANNLYYLIETTLTWLILVAGFFASSPVIFC